MFLILKKKMHICLPVFLSLVVLLVPMRASAAVGVGSVWDGSFSVNFPDSILYLEYSRSYRYNLSSTAAIPNYTYQYFESNDNVTIDIVSDSTDIYLNGTFRIRVNIEPEDPTNLSYLTVSADPVVLPGVFLSVEMISRLYGGKTTYDICIEFDNYYVNQSSITLPIKINHVVTGVFSTQSANSPNQVKGIISIVSDYAGDIMQYDNLEDVPSVDGYLSQQNQTIIDQSQTQNNLTTEQNTLIQNQTSLQHQDSQNEINQAIANSQAQINQSIQNTDQITNGYNSSQMGDTENKFESGAGDLEDIEDTLTDSSSSYVDNFTDSGFDTSFLQSVGPSLNYVVTWFTNFWNMGGALTSTYSLCFAVFIGFYILRVRG